MNPFRGWDEQSYTIQAGGRHAPIHPQANKMIKILAQDVTGEEKWQEVKRVWRENFAEEEFPRFDAFLVEGNPIKIGQVREAERFLHTKPVSAVAKVLIFKAAEKMTLSAANAFLKTLEEPPGQSLLFLLSDKPYELPETVLSRCQMIHLKRKKCEVDFKVGTDLARRLAKGNLGERWELVVGQRQNKEELLRFIQSQISVWRNLWLSHVAKNEEGWFRQGLQVFITAEKLLLTNVNQKMVEGWIGLFLPGKKGVETKKSG